jgi:hypothetical protein
MNRTFIKVNIVVLYAMPTNVIWVRKFLGLAKYHSGMIFFFFIKIIQMKLYEPRQVESSLYELSLNLYKPEFLFMLCSFNK